MRKFIKLISLIPIVGLAVYLGLNNFYEKKLTTELKPEIAIQTDSFQNIKELKQTIVKKSGLGSDEDFSLKMKSDPQLAKPGKHQLDLEVTPRWGETKQLKVTVIIKDNQPPQVTTKSVEVVAGTAIDYQKLVSAVDRQDGKISVKQIQHTKVDPNKLGKQEVIFSVNDQAGNTTRKKATIIVKAKPPTAKKEPALTEKREDTRNFSEQVSKVVSDSDAQESPMDQNEAPGKNIRTAKAAIPYSTITFLGEVIPFVHTNGAESAPATGAGTWTGTGAVDDGAPTHFIGHNPGDFHDVLNLTVGSLITVTDDNGNRRTYCVYELVDAYDNGINVNNPNDDTFPRVIDQGGERITLQTCITDAINRIVLAR